MKQAWPKKRLGDLCLVNPREGKISLPPEGSKVSFVPMSAIDEKAGLIRLREIREYREVAKGYTSFRNNDVLFAKITPCMQNGKAAIARDLVGNIGFGSTEFHVLRPGSELLPEWVFAFLRQPLFKITAAANFTGTGGQQRVSASFMANSLIPVPPLPEQKRIVAILDAAAELRSLREKADQRTSYLIPALFHKMFGNPATNPMGWPIVRVRDVMTSCEYGTSTKGNEEGRGVPVLRMGNVTTEGNLDLSDLKHVDLSEAEQEKYRLQEGDVLFNRTNSRVLVGKTGMWDGRFPAVAASYFIRLRFNDEKEHPQHFTTFMNLPEMKRELAGMARGAVGQANINGKELQGIRFPLPPTSLQRKFAGRVAEIRAMEAQQAESCRRLDNLFQSLLHRAFRGDL